MRKLINWHNWLGVPAFFTVLLFAVSGVLHPIMNRLQPQAVHQSAPETTAPGPRLPLKTVLAEHGIAPFAAVRSIDSDRPGYRVTLTDGRVRYFFADNGAEMADGERQHAIALARHFSGDANAAIRDARLIEAFDADYPSVNRLLPVWRIALEREDGLTAYVDTAGNRLATLTDDRKRVLQTAFRWLHGFSFLEDAPELRLTLLSLLLAAALLTALVGFALFVRMKRASTRLQQRPLQRWHRHLSWLAGLSLFAFLLSGLWHLWQSELASGASAPPAVTFSSDELGAYTPEAPFQLLRVDGRACYRFAQRVTMDEHAGHGHMRSAAPTAAAQCHDAISGEPIIDAEQRLAIALARHHSGAVQPVRNVELLTRFDDEYGFINKRLPVWRVVFAGTEDAWYVETGSGALAARVTTAARWEGNSFSWLHKWQFFGEHKNWRDLALSLFALGGLALCAMGLWLYLRKVFRREARA